jgi:hypothetical protein
VLIAKPSQHERKSTARKHLGSLVFLCLPVNMYSIIICGGQYGNVFNTFTQNFAKNTNIYFICQILQTLYIRHTFTIRDSKVFSDLPSTIQNWNNGIKMYLNLHCMCMSACLNLYNNFNFPLVCGPSHKRDYQGHGIFLQRLS